MKELRSSARRPPTARPTDPPTRCPQASWAHSGEAAMGPQIEYDQGQPGSQKVLQVLLECQFYRGPPSRGKQVCHFGASKARFPMRNASFDMHTATISYSFPPTTSSNNTELSKFARMTNEVLTCRRATAKMRPLAMGLEDSPDGSKVRAIRGEN